MKQQILTILGLLLSLFMTPVFSSDDEAEIGKAPNAPKIESRIIHRTSPGVSADRIAGLTIRSGQDNEFNRNKIKVQNQRINAEQVLTLEEKADKAVQSMTTAFNTIIFNGAEKIIPQIVINSVPAALINDIMIKEDDDLTTQARKLIFLGTRIRNTDINVDNSMSLLPQAIKNNIAADCFIAASKKFEEASNLPQLSFLERVDNTISTKQLYFWAACNMSYVNLDQTDNKKIIVATQEIRSQHCNFYKQIHKNVNDIVLTIQNYQKDSIAMMKENVDTVIDNLTTVFQYSSKINNKYYDDFIILNKMKLRAQILLQKNIDMLKESLLLDQYLKKIIELDQTAQNKLHDIKKIIKLEQAK